MTTYDYLKLTRYYHTIHVEPLMEYSFYFYYDLEQIFLNKFLSLFTKQDFLTNVELRMDPMFIEVFKAILSTRHGKVIQININTKEKPILVIHYDDKSSKFYECHKEIDPVITESNKEFGLPDLCQDVQKVREFIDKIKLIGWFNIHDFYKSIKRYWETVIYYPDSAIRPEWQHRANLSDPCNKEYLEEAIRRKDYANELCNYLVEVLFDINMNNFKQLVELYGEDKKTLIFGLMEFNEMSHMTIKI